MTVELPCNTATFTINAPTSISPNCAQAKRGVARREFRRMADAKYSKAISKKIIQTSSTSRPCAVSAR
jgi:hypothetical protein